VNRSEIMNRIMGMFLGVTLSLSLTGCSEHSDNEDITAPSDPGIESSVADFNPEGLSFNQDEFEIVLMDSDRWYLMLNVRKGRRISYSTDSLFTYHSCATFFL